MLMQPEHSKPSLFELQEENARPIASLIHLLDVKPLAIRHKIQYECGPGEGWIRLSSSTGNCFALVLRCDEHEFGRHEQTLKELLSRSPTASIGILIDLASQAARFLRRRFDRNEFAYVAPFDLMPEASAAGDAGWLYVNGNTSTGRPLNVLSEKVEGVFFEIHSHFRDIDGLHADEALDELCKVLYTKLFDEEQTLQDHPYRMQRRGHIGTEECAADIRALYMEAVAYDQRVFEAKIPGYARSRGVFSAPIRLSSAALVKAVEALQAYSLSASAFDVKGRAFQKVIGPATRSGMGQYFTPLPIIEFLVKCVAPTYRELVLDPFCGSGHFLTCSLDQVRRAKNCDEKLFHEFAFGKLHGIEKSDRMVRVAMTDMRLHGDGHSNIRCTDALLPFSNYPDLKPGSFDVVLTNPPFGCILGRETVAQYGAFDLASQKSMVPLEILGLERCLQVLRPGGRLGIVLPEGVIANRNTAYVRRWLQSNAKIRGIISLPIETFAPFGASIKTCIVIARKWEPGESTTQAYNVKLARVDSVGYDASGRGSPSTDLTQIADVFQDFISAEGW